MLTTIPVALALVYAAIALVALTAIRRAKSEPAPRGEHVARKPAEKRAVDEISPADRPLVSVLVAARNEADYLPDCLRFLQAQSLERGRFEIIVIDDHSIDGTSAVATDFGVQCIRLSGDAAGKAAALHAGIGVARGRIIAVTDADCRPPKRWLEEMVRTMRDDSVGMVCGVTVVAGRSLLARIQAADWTLLLTIAAGFSALGLPLTAMGNNMIFRRGAYDAVGGYPSIPPSVTEDYALFRAVHRRTHWRVRLLLAYRLRNVTLPLRKASAVLRQRRRWARGGLRADLWVYVFYGLVYVVHGGVAAALIAAPFWGFGALLLKLCTDAIVLHAGGRRLSQRHLRPSFFLFEAVLFAYVLAMPLLLAAAPRIKWRGRRW